MGHISLLMLSMLSRVSLFRFLHDMIQCFKSLLLYKDILNIAMPNLVVIAIQFSSLFNSAMMFLIVVDIFNYLEIDTFMDIDTFTCSNNLLIYNNLKLQ